MKDRGLHNCHQPKFSARERRHHAFGDRDGTLGFSFPGGQTCRCGVGGKRSAGLQSKVEIRTLGFPRSLAWLPKRAASSRHSSGTRGIGRGSPIPPRPVPGLARPGPSLHPADSTGQVLSLRGVDPPPALRATYPGRLPLGRGCLGGGTFPLLCMPLD